MILMWDAGSVEPFPSQPLRPLVFEDAAPELVLRLNALSGCFSLPEMKATS